MTRSVRPCITVPADLDAAYRAARKASRVPPLSTLVREAMRGALEAAGIDPPPAPAPTADPMGAARAARWGHGEPPVGDRYAPPATHEQPHVREALAAAGWTPALLRRGDAAVVARELARTIKGIGPRVAARIVAAARGLDHAAIEASLRRR